METINNESKEDIRSWAYALSFIISKDIDAGKVENKLKELDSSVRILELQKRELMPASNEPERSPK